MPLICWQQPPVWWSFPQAPNVAELTSGMKNERILRHLLEMIDLDSSEYVRLMVSSCFNSSPCGAAYLFDATSVFPRKNESAQRGKDIYLFIEMTHRRANKQN